MKNPPSYFIKLYIKNIYSNIGIDLVINLSVYIPSHDSKCIIYMHHNINNDVLPEF